jgi:hypothetical protein
MTHIPRSPSKQYIADMNLSLLSTSTLISLLKAIWVGGPISTQRQWNSMPYNVQTELVKREMWNAPLLSYVGQYQRDYRDIYSPNYHALNPVDNRGSINM